MKKVVSLLSAFMVLLAGALFVMMSRPAPDPGLFLPSVDGGIVQVHLRRGDLAMEWLLDLDEFVRSKDLPPSGLNELIPFVGRGSLQAELDLPEGFSDRFFLALEVIEVPKAIKLSQTLKDEAVRRGWEALPLDVPLPQDIAPLFVLVRDDFKSYWGLWRRRAGSVILVASSLEDLASMVPEGVLPVRQTSGSNWARLNLPRFASSDDHRGFSSEWSLSRTDERISLSSWNNGHEVFLSRDSLSDLAEIEEIPLYGGGKLAVLAAFTGGTTVSPPDEIMESLLDEKSRLLLDGWVSLAQNMGFSWEDIVAALQGRTSFVLGSNASGLMGPMPGGYVLFEGISPDLGRKIVDCLAPLNLPFGAGPLKKAGWQGGLSFKLPLTAVLAYGDRGLLAGVFDPDDIDRRPTVPERIFDSVGKARYLAFSVDVRGLLAILETYRSMASLLDDDLASILGSFMEILSPWDKFELYTPSIGRSELLLYRLRN